MTEYHEVADLFPMMTDHEFDDLVESIAANGLREPIWLHSDGRIIDGRNRHRACLQAGVEPEFRTYAGSDEGLVLFVLDLNLHRRHLTESQRAMVAAKAATLQKGANQHASIEAPSQSAAAEQLSVSRSAVQRAAQVRDHGTPEMVADVEAGELAVSKAAAIIKEAGKEPEQIQELYAEVKKNNGLNVLQSNSNEWYTPEKYLESARSVMGGIDLDPASNPTANERVQASTFYTKDDDGLSKGWKGRVWLNPPYGGFAGAFVAKAVESYTAGEVAEVILLLSAHSTDTRWFQPLWDYALCFTDHRISYISGDGNGSVANTGGSVFVYLGEDVPRFAEEFKRYGAVVRRA